MDCSLPGSSIHGIFQARVLEWVAISFSRGSSWPGDRTQVSRIAGRCFTLWATREARNAKVGNKEIPGVTGKFGLRVQNEAEQRLTVLPRERTGHSKHPLPTCVDKNKYYSHIRMVVLWVFFIFFSNVFSLLFTSIWVNSGSWWWTGRPGVLRFMGSQRVGHDWATELNFRF